VDLIRDVLDKQVLARNGVKLGKVDAIVIELDGKAAPKVAFIEMGAAVLARRLGSWPGAACRSLGIGKPRRIPWERVSKIGLNIEIDVAADELTGWQRWLRDRVIRRIPGA
jgi:sporulation protein YlmC with PRC-barrel domain